LEKRLVLMGFDALPEVEVNQDQLKGFAPKRVQASSSLSAFFVANGTLATESSLLVLDVQDLTKVRLSTKIKCTEPFSFLASHSKLFIATSSLLHELRTSGSSIDSLSLTREYPLYGFSPLVDASLQVTDDQMVYVLAQKEHRRRVLVFDSTQLSNNLLYSIVPAGLDINQIQAYK